ncbi:11866_t:CDS:2, partial [Acaulospora colombiana]
MPSTDRQTALDLYKYVKYFLQERNSYLSLSSASPDLNIPLYLRSSVELEERLRQVSKHKPPYDKQVTALRISLRDHYERIVLLDYELSQSKEVEQNLWKYVYYKFIEEYRKKIRASLNSGEKSKGAPRKLSSAFRSFLQEATGFYHDFVKKLAVHFGLKQLDPIIQKFGSTLESTDTSHCPYDDDIKQKVVLSCHKILIFLGDLARYRELQNDKLRKNWSTACDYYNNARQLVPESGNPHNQLAVIATYNADDLSAVYHYYRSLVLRYPFLTAKDNISLLFQKVMKSSTETSERVQENSREIGNRRRFSHQRQTNKSRTGDATQSFFADFIRLHSILYLREGIEFYSELKNSELNKLRELTQARALDSDQLLKFTVINMAALYVIRRTSNGENAHSDHGLKATNSAHSQSSKKFLVEKHAVMLILDTLSTLLEMCNFELTDVVNGGLEQNRNAVQILPAPIKRSLMSIRVSVKWIYSSLDYLTRISTQISNDPFLKDEFVNFARFWEQFAKFLNTMERLFPHEHGAPLD